MAEAATRLGINRSALYRQLERLGLRPARTATLAIDSLRAIGDDAPVIRGGRYAARMLCVLLLTLTQSDSGAASLETPPPAEGALAPETDGPHIEGAERSAGLFTEPRVKAGVVVGRMGMGLLFGGSALGLGGALMVVAALAGAPAALLVVGAVLLGGLTALSTALGAAMFGRDYGRDFTDALLISMASAVVAGLLFVAGFFAPVLLLPAAIIGVALMVAGVPLLVQTFKSQDDGPEPSLALLRF